MAENKELDAQEAENLDDESEPIETEPVDQGKKEPLPDWAREQITRANKQAAAQRVQARKAQEALEAFKKEQELAKKTSEERLNQELAEARIELSKATQRAKIVETKSMIIARASSMDFRDPDMIANLIDLSSLSDDSDMRNSEIEDKLADLAAKKIYLLKDKQPKTEQKITTGGPAVNPQPPGVPMPKFTDANIIQKMRDDAAAQLSKGNTIAAVKLLEQAYQTEHHKGG